jgi:hypothetical protein
MKKIITVLALLAPSIALAQQGLITDANSLTLKLTSLGNQFLGLLMAAAVIFIVWHVVLFILNASDPEKRKEHQGGVLWGIVGLAIILSIWGLVAILTGTFRTANQAPPQPYPVVLTPPPSN